MAPDPTRRGLLAGLAGGALSLVLPQAVPAMTADQATRLIDRVVAEINAAINSGRSEGAMYREFERIMARHANVPYLALNTLGRAAATRATRAQLQDYNEVFRAYISRKYGSRFREFIGGRLEVTGVRDLGQRVQVVTTAYLRGEDPFEVVFEVRERSGRLLFENMYIEGVNMLAQERELIRPILDRNGGDIEALMRALRAAG